jgi:phosphatidylinositol alpha-1,6-mannosyltransferase
MRVFIVATGIFNKGGIERYTRYQYKALQELYGEKNIFLASFLGKDVNTCFEDDIEITYNQNGKNFFHKMQFIWKCLLLIRSNKIQLVISNHRQLSVIAYLAKILFKIPYVTNVYGLEIWSGMNKVETFALLKSNALIADCNFIRKYINKHYNYSLNNIKLLFDAVDIERFKPKVPNDSIYSAYKIPKDKFIVATIGRLARNKGHELMIETMVNLPDEVFYLIVGGGKYEQKFKQFALSKGVTNRVIFTGRVPEDELVDLYNIANVVVLASTFDNNEGEGLPLGLIEASSCGKPIICGNEDGSLDAISADNPNGIIINPRSSAELGKAINIYLATENVLEMHGNNGREHVRANFAFSVFKKRLSAIVESI